RVAQILRLLASAPVEDHIAEALFFTTGEQPAEDRIAVKTGKAPPDKPGVRIEKGRGSPVANGREMQRLFAHFYPLAEERTPPCASAASQLLTCAGDSNVKTVPFISRPTP